MTLGGDGGGISEHAHSPHTASQLSTACGSLFAVPRVPLTVGSTPLRLPLSPQLLDLRREFRAPVLL